MADGIKISQLAQFSGKQLSDIFPFVGADPYGNYVWTVQKFLNLGMTGVTGGGASNLDGWSTVNEAAGQFWKVVGSDNLMMPYQLQLSTAAASVPNIVRPLDFSAGNNPKVFQLLGFKGTQLVLTGVGGGGYVELPGQSGAPSTPSSALRIYGDSSNRLSWIATDGYSRSFSGTLTSSRVYTLPDVSGTVALTASTIPSIAGTLNQVLVNGDVVAVTGTSVTLSLPQNIHTGATPTFAGMTLNGGSVTSNTTLSLASSSNGNIHILPNGTGVVGVGSTAFTSTDALNVGGSVSGIAIKNSRSGSNNNWSLIRNTATTSNSNLEFTTGLGIALTLNNDLTATHTGAVSITTTGTALTVGSGGTGAGTARIQVNAGSAAGGIASVQLTQNNDVGNSCYLGQASQANDLATGAAAGTLVLRSRVGGLLVSVNDGGTTGLVVAQSGKFTLLPGSFSASAWGTTGALSHHSTSTVTDSSTAGSGTAASAVFHSFAAPTLAATNASVTTTDAATLYIAGGPIAGTNQTITRAWGLWNVGKSRFDDNMIIGSAAAPGARLDVRTSSGLDAFYVYDKDGTLQVKVTQFGELVAANGINSGSSGVTLPLKTGATTVATISSSGVAVGSGLALQLGNAYVAGAPTATGYVTLKDSTGTTYKVLVST